MAKGSGSETKPPVWPIPGGEATPGVELVPVGPEHADRMARWMRDPDVVRGLGVRGTPTLESTHAWIEHALADPSSQPFAVLADGEHVGNVVLDLLDRHLGSARLSIYIGEGASRGDGIGTAAVAHALERAREVLGLHKVWLTVHAGNAAAIAVYERCGFQTEGTLRDEFLLDGERVDALRMGVILGGGAE